MAIRKSNAAPVRGWHAPGPRFTRWAAVYFVAFVVAPILGLALLLDVALYLLFRYAFESCYGVLCLL